MPISGRVVLRFGGRRVPRALAGLAVVEVDSPTVIDTVVAAGRLSVLGTDADLGTVLSRLLKLDRLDVEVAYLPRRRTPATRAYGLPTGRRAARAAATGTARELPLIRDELGNVLTGRAHWAGAPPALLYGEAVVDDTVLFDGAVAAVRVEPTYQLPGLRAAVLSGRMRPLGWASGRAAQLGTTGAYVSRDGETSDRAVRRFAYYRHIAGWRAVC